MLCGLTLVTVLLAAMAGLIHAEVRDRRRAVHRGGRSQPHAFGQARRTGSRPGSGTARGHRSSRPAAAAGSGGDPWAPFTVRPDTGLDEIKRQYRILARRHHPDRGGDPRTMARINLLYADLLRRRA